MGKTVEEFHKEFDAMYEKHTPDLKTSETEDNSIPSKDVIIRICKLHKAWSIMAPWENIEDFVTNNWNSKNII